MTRSEIPDGLRRRMLATFVYIDELLDETERKLAAGSAQRPFLPFIADATPVQAQVIGDYAARMRQTMLATLRRLQIEPPAPDVSAVWAARSSLGSAGIAAMELTSRRMRGYGGLSEDLARELSLASTTLTDLLERMDSYLVQASDVPEGAVAARIPRSGAETMLEIAIPGRGVLRLKHLVLDYNGTLALDGVLLPGVRERLDRLSKQLRIHVVTADTFGRAREHLHGMLCELTLLPAQAQADAKRAFVKRLGADATVCIGNGNNDRLMMERAALAIATIQEEGAAVAAVQAADVVVNNALDALDLLIQPLRMVATLRE